MDHIVSVFSDKIYAFICTCPWQCNMLLEQFKKCIRNRNDFFIVAGMGGCYNVDTGNGAKAGSGGEMV